MRRRGSSGFAEENRTCIMISSHCQRRGGNTKAIGFYLRQAFELIGLDTCCYTNDDIGRREVRINPGFFFHREGRRRYKYFDFAG